ncbi:MAG: hypothetical protein IPP27_08425 [Bacteroidetes bacterium]|nr:hypothetical protein [Bacteroidota bacterium]
MILTKCTNDQCSVRNTFEGVKATSQFLTGPEETNRKAILFSQDTFVKATASSMS